MNLKLTKEELLRRFATKVKCRWCKRPFGLNKGLESAVFLNANKELEKKLLCRCTYFRCEKCGKDLKNKEIITKRGKRVLLHFENMCEKHTKKF